MGRRIYNKICAYDFCGRPFWTLDPEQKCCCDECQKRYEEALKTSDYFIVRHYENETRVYTKIDRSVSDNMQELNKIALECYKAGIHYGEYMRRLYAEHGKYL